MERVYAPVDRWELCSRLATLALDDGNAGMLKAILEVHGKNRIQWPFHYHFDLLKHEEGGDPELISVVENSEFRSMVPPGKRFSDLHPLSYF